MKKRILSVLTALALVLTLFPSAAIAAESGAAPDSMGIERGYREEHVSVPDAEDLPSNDELFAGYVEQMLYGDLLDGMGLFGVRNPAKDKLNDLEKKGYDSLKQQIETVAESGGSTKFTVTLNDLGIETTSKTFNFTSGTQTLDVVTVTSTDLSINGSLYNGEKLTTEATAALNTYMERTYPFDCAAIISALLVDLPYELYWFDKTTKYSLLSPLPGIVTSPSANEIYLYGNAEFTLRVAQTYAVDSNRLTVKNVGTTVNTVKNNALAIVNKTYNSDYERLKGYCDEICNLVSYNDAAAGGGVAYGDPWQLIHVFDHTEASTTKQVVCEGYAKAFQYLCDLSVANKKFTNDKIDSYTVTGYMASTDSTGAGGSTVKGAGPHMWNVVTMDNDKSYLVDVTNCDAGTIGSNYQLFLVGSAGGSADTINYIEIVYNEDGTEKEQITHKEASDYDFTNTSGQKIHYQADAESKAMWGTILTLDAQNYPRTTPLSGTVTITGTAKYGETLSADYDGSETVTYKWLRDGEEIDTATSNTYTLTVADIDREISVRVSAEGYSDKTSNSVGPVEKADVEIQGRDQVSVTVGGKASLNVSVSQGEVRNLHYVSKNENIAKVTFDEYNLPTVTGVAKGTTQIEISLVSDTYKAEIKTVTVEVSDLPSQTVTFADGDTAKTVTYGDAKFTNAATAAVTTGTPGNITYSSSNAGVAAVDNNGEVTIAGVGTATITATAAKVEGQYAETSESYTLTVNPKTITPAVQVTGGPYTYNDGAEIKPNVTVSSEALVNGDALTEGTDYTVTYSNNTNAGTATVTVTAKAGSNYTWNPAATADFTINKKAGPAAPAVSGSYAVSTADTTKFVYTINPIEGAEYSKDGTDYGDSNVFDNIEPLSKATFYARIKGTDNVEAGAAGNTGEVTFNKLNHAHPPVLEYAVSGEAGARTVTITPVEGAEYSFDGGTTWGSEHVRENISGDSVTVGIRLPETATMTGTDAVTAEVDLTKTSQAAPEACELTLTLNEDGTAYTATITEIEGAEYRFDDGEWGPNNTLTNIVPGTEVTGHVRMKATEEYLASPSVSATKTAPLLKAATPVASPAGGATFTDTLSVTLSCDTVGASIYYTTDGTEPTTDSTQYTTEISLTATTTIKAIAVKDGMVNSDVLTAVYTKQPPVVDPDPEPPVIHVTGVSLDQSVLHLTVGGTAQLVASVAPGNADNRNVTWSSSEPAVAAVSGGAVTALRPGSAAITVTTVDGGYAASCAVTVTAPVTPPVNPGNPGGGYPTTPVTPVVPNTPSNPGASNNNNNNNSSTNNPGDSAPSTPSNSSVAPEATVSGGTASAVVSGDMASQLVDQAASGVSTVVIAPEISGSVNRTEVSIPASAVSGIAGGSSAALKVETPAANITISNSGLASLGGQDVTIAAEKTGGTVSVEITAGGQTVSSVTGGLKVEIPADCGPGTVAQLVDENGNVLSTLRKSYASGQTMNVPLEGSAKVIFVDNGKSFADVPAGNWAANAVAFASGHELMNGVSASSFSPAEPMTRGMLAVVLHNLEGNPGASYSGSFGDVGGNDWYAQAVQWAADNSIVTGVSDGVFAPNASITREQLVVMLYRYAGEPNAGGSLTGFSDSANVSSWAQQAMTWAVSSGIVGGSNGALNPQSGATRAEVAQMLMNFVTTGEI